MFPPSFAQIEPSGECNLRCPLCLYPCRNDRHAGGGPAFMSLGIFTSLLDQMDGIEELHLQGLGEPLLNPDFIAMAALAASRGVRVTTSTNLSILPHRLAQALFESGLFCIHISLDGATARTYETMRPGGSFAALLRHMALLGTVKKSGSFALPHLRLTTVLTRANLRELVPLVDLAALYGMEEIFVQGLCHGLGDPPLGSPYRLLRERMEKEDYLGEDGGVIEEIFRSAAERAEGLGVGLRLPHPGPRDPGEKSPCDWPGRGIYITYRGHVTPCCMIPTSDRMLFGDATVTPVRNIWESESYEIFRKECSSGKPPDLCRECAIFRGTF